MPINMACVPLSLKSLLLIDDVDGMAELLDTTLAKRVMFDRRSIDVRLYAMLTRPQEAKARAVTFATSPRSTRRPPRSVSR